MEGGAGGGFADKLHNDVSAENKQRAVAARSSASAIMKLNCLNDGNTNIGAFKTDLISGERAAWLW